MGKSRVPLGEGEVVLEEYLSQRTINGDDREKIYFGVR
jgi:hypothetical protein